MLTNDNNSAGEGEFPPLPDPHGLAALLLVESLIHGLCERSTLTAAESVEIAERAVSVQAEQADAADGAADAMWRSHELLSSIAASLKTDRQPPTPRLVV